MPRLITNFMLALTLATCWATGDVFAQTDTLSYPRLAIFHYTDFLTKNQAEELAKWDVIVMGPQVPYFSPEAFRHIKTINPNVKLLCYINGSARIANPNFQPGDPQWVYRQGMRDEWLLKTASGLPAGGHWPGVQIMNPTRHCFVYDDKQWSSYIAWIATDIMVKNPEWDGFFLDDALPSISWLNDINNVQIDINNDGVADSRNFIDQEWNTELQKEIDGVRALDTTKIVLTNSSFWPGTHGRLFENYFYDATNWITVKDEIQNAVRLSRKPSFVTVNANTRNTGDWQNWLQFRFAFCSILMTDALVSYDKGDQDHSQIWWYDEYAADLGLPLGEATQMKPGVWIRFYQRGVVVVNTTTVVQSVDFETDYAHLSGTQDTLVNNGQTVQSVMVGALDGVVLKTTSTTGVGSERNAAPSGFRLEQNYPNPFNPSTSIRFSLGRRVKVSLKVYDLLGREVATLVNGEKAAGEYTVIFMAESLPTGVYFYRLTAGKEVMTKKMVVVK